MRNIFEMIAFFAQGLTTILTLLILIIKPFRNWMLGLTDKKKSDDEALKCLLRSEITRIYYKNAASKEVHSYEFENVSYLYKAYKKLGGNSFVDKIWEEMQMWKIIL